jgi:hypothetical protein
MYASDSDLADARFAGLAIAAPGWEWSIVPLDVCADHVGCLVVERAAGELKMGAGLRPATLDLMNMI